MPTKPTVKPQWAENDVVDPTSGQNNVAEPPLAKKTDGIDFEEIIPRQWQNWLQRIIYRWVDWFDGTTIPLSSDVGTSNEQLSDGTGHTHALNGASQAEAEAGADNTKVMTPLRVRQAIDKDTPVVSGFTKTVAYYVDSDGDSQGDNVFDASSIALGAWYTLGPTGSGADYTWSALDNIPVNSKFVDFDILHISDLGSASTREIYLRRNGSGSAGGGGVSPPDGTLSARLGGLAASATRIDDTKMARSTLNDSSVLIDVYISGTIEAPNSFYFILRGFGV